MLTLGISAGCGLLFFLGTPFVLVLALWVLATSLWVVDYPLANMGLASIDSLKSFAFLAVPLFIATGDFLTAGRMSAALVNLSRSLVAFLPGRTAATAAVGSGLFSAVSGSNAATAATMGQLLGPEFRKIGASPGQAAAIIATAGCLGIIIPPSTLFIIYGVTMGVSTVELNIGGILPGILFMLVLVAHAAWINRRLEPSLGWAGWSFAAVLREARSAYLGLLAIVVLFSGLYFGWFSSTEAAGVATIYCMLAGLLITKGFRLRDVPKVLEQSAAITGIIAPLVVFSLQFQQVLSVMDVPSAIQGSIQSLGEHSTLLAIGAMMLLVFVAGCFVESVAVVLILGPIFAPVAAKLGLHPVHWGMIFVVGTSIGFVTPPYGLNLFVVSAVMGVPYARVVREIMPFLLPLVAGWIAIAAIPWLTLVLL